MPNPITVAALAEVLHYCPSTGVFTWRKHRDFAKIGEVAGTKTSHGYTVICINGEQYYAHRLAWLWVTGYVSPFCIDHIDRVRDNNKFNNLRMASRGQNRQNLSKALKNNKSTGILGVYAVRKQFLARITVNGKTHNLGLHPTPEDAYCAYVMAKKDLHVWGELA